ncbi:ABC transporter ATP-binding protein [Sporolactobacillus terrae]|uniref:ABC transporter ATP-binding protein n=1 Tax=Sporolactobacillus terrae TaxID=269673 RepID=UPI00111905DE|nr:oligopeptide/dipeptide ABC transporter ATP-binding protein [Sporolactobacillus terrae]
MSSELVQVKNLNVTFTKKRGFLKHHSDETKAVNNVNLSVKEGETLGIVGESGCGKSTLARTLLTLQKPTSGTVLFKGEDIFQYTHAEKHKFRKDVQMIFQDPLSSLNPRMSVGEIIAAPLKAFGYPKEAIKKNVRTLMDLVGIDPKYANRLPHEFSGGQCQRIGIARAIALKPKLIVCDEPVSALDVSIQAQIINLLKDLQKEFNLTYLFISHDLSVVKNIADRIAVIYLGQVKELASNESFFTHPSHPYTNKLLSVIPIPDPKTAKTRTWAFVKEDQPSLITHSSGCAFYPRCPIAQDYCKTHDPELTQLAEHHDVACFYPMNQGTR